MVKPSALHIANSSV